LVVRFVLAGATAGTGGASAAGAAAFTLTRRRVGAWASGAAGDAPAAGTDPADLLVDTFAGASAGSATTAAVAELRPPDRAGLPAAPVVSARLATRGALVGAAGFATSVAFRLRPFLTGAGPSAGEVSTEGSPAAAFLAAGWRFRARRTSAAIISSLGVPDTVPTPGSASSTPRRWGSSALTTSVTSAPRESTSRADRGGGFPRLASGT
jgi:hypothetical protein